MTTPPLNLRPITPPGSPSASDFSYETSPNLYLFTSLTAGSSHIITATSRLETILKANRVPFKAVDCATDEKARRIWSRRAGKRKLPGLVKEGTILADLEQVEEWNEFGEIKDNLGGGHGPATEAFAATQAAAAMSKEAAANNKPAAPPVQDTTTAVPSSSSSSSSSSSAATATATATTVQAAQQQQQALLAREAAAMGAQRGKPKPAASSSSDPAAPITLPPAADIDTTAPAPATTTDAPRKSSEATPRSPPRSPELDQDYDLDNPQHNTSSSAALGPLSIRTLNPAAFATAEGTEQAARGRSDTTTSLASPSLPNAPPSTAVEPSTSMDAALASEMDNAAGPASKSGLAAVTDHPELASAEKETETHRGAEVSAASDAEIKAVESRDSIPEEGEGQAEGTGKAAEAEEGDDDDDDDTMDTPHSPPPESDTEEAAPRDNYEEYDDRSPRILEGNPNRHIKFQENEVVKEDAKDGDMAAKSVGD